MRLRQRGKRLKLGVGLGLCLQKIVELSCPACAGNRLHFPRNDNEPVVCEDCRITPGSLEDAKAIIEGKTRRWPLKNQSDAERAAARRKRHTSEIEASQAGLRASIAETDRLVGESEEMLRRHHKECDDDI
jgi:hypothetical protein